MKLSEAHDEMLCKLRVIEDAHERFASMIDHGRRVPPLNAEFCTDTFKVNGCISQVWLVPEVREGKCYFSAQADSPIMQGIVTLLCEFYSGYPPQEVMAVEPDFLDQGGILLQLTPTRRIGVSKIRDRICRLAEGLISN